jgi:hypothetical protein
MSKLFTRASVTGASLAGANLKATLTALWDALSAAGVTDSARTTITASATLLTTQCGILLVDCTAGSVVLTLPTSGTSSDEALYKIRRIDSTYANTLTVQRGGTDSVEGSTSVAVLIGCGGQVNLKLPGGSSDWKVVGRGGGTMLAAREALGVPAGNWLDNPDGEVYQRAVAATADDTYSEDRWYELTQTGTVTPSQVTTPEDGFAFAARITQSQAAAQRFGRAQILEGKASKKVRGKTMTFGGRLKLSTSANVRMAILAWTGTEDVVTSDVVNDWTLSTYTAGNFFLAANLTVVAVSPSIAMTAATARDCSVTGVIPSNANNVIVMYWTEAAAAQNVTLDAWGRRLVEGATLVDYVRRSSEHELAICQRHYERGFVRSDAYNVTGSAISACSNYKVTKRANPTTVISTPGYVNASGAAFDGSSDAESFEIKATIAATGSGAFTANWTASADL